MRFMVMVKATQDFWLWQVKSKEERQRAQAEQLAKAAKR